MREWLARTDQTIAVRGRPPRSMVIGFNEVAILVRNGEVGEPVSESLLRTQGLLGALLGKLGVGPKLEVYITHTAPIKLTYWLGDSSNAGGDDSIDPLLPVATADGQPVLAQVNVEVVVSQQAPENILRIFGTKSSVTVQYLQSRLADETRAKLAPLIEQRQAKDLRGNQPLLRTLYDQASEELSGTLFGFGLELTNFYVNWGLNETEIRQLQTARSLHQHQLANFAAPRAQVPNEPLATPHVEETEPSPPIPAPSGIEVAQDTISRDGFLQSMVAQVSERLSLDFIKQRRSLFASSDGSTRVVFVTSRRYDSGTGDGYWFGIKTTQEDDLAAESAGYITLGCGAPDLVFLVPLDEFLKWKPYLNTTERPGQTFHHVRIHSEGDSHVLRMTNGASDVDLALFQIPSGQETEFADQLGGEPPLVSPGVVKPKPAVPGPQAHESSADRTAPPARDLTKFTVSTNDGHSSGLGKGRAMLKLFEALVAAGASPEEVIATLSTAHAYREYVVRSALSVLDGDAFVKAIQDNQGPDDRIFQSSRYFCKTAELVQCDGISYALTNQWGRETDAAMEALLDRFPSSEYGVDVTAES